MLPIVDTHQHLWDLRRFSLPWLDGEGTGPLRGNHLLGDYLAASEGTGIDRTIYMEVDLDPDQRPEEAEFAIGMCESPDNPVAGAVISGSPGEEGFRDYIDRFKGNRFVKGVRQVLHVPNAEPGRCLREGFVRDVRYLGEAGMSFDLCLRPAELEDATRLADQCPETCFILDHCGNADPGIVNGAAGHDPANPFSHTREQWLSDIGALGEREHVVCKISGIVARAPAGWNAATLAPAVDHCLDSFGPERVVFGGDWPVCNLGADLGAWTAALREIVSGRPLEEQARLFAGNAARIYGLE